MPSLQHLELQILLALVRVGEDSYTPALVQALEAQSGRAIAPAAVFIVLTRLEKKGLVTSRLDTTAAARARRYFRLTRAGMSAIKTHQAEFARLWRGIDRLLDGKKV